MAYSSNRQDRQTLENVGKALWEAAVVIKVRKKDLMKWPNDIEMLHQYRISIRVARSLVKFIKPYQKRSQNDQLKAVLKQLQDPTSRMRELDVLVPRLEPGSTVRAMCERAQAQTRADFISGMKTEETQLYLAFVDDALRNIQWKKETARRGIPAEELAARVEAKRAYCEETLANLDFTQQDAVHDLRKQAKALRYVARELGDYLPEGAGQVGARMREVQDKLGDWCDARVNAALVDVICGAEGVAVAQAFQQQAQDILDELKSSQASNNAPDQDSGQAE